MRILSMQTQDIQEIKSHKDIKKREGIDSLYFWLITVFQMQESGFYYPTPPSGPVSTPPSGPVSTPPAISSSSSVAAPSSSSSPSASSSAATVVVLSILLNIRG